MRKHNEMDKDLKRWGMRVDRALPPMETEPPPCPQNTLRPAPVRPGKAGGGFFPHWTPAYAWAGLALAAGVVFLLNKPFPRDPDAADVQTVEPSGDDFTDRIPYYREIARLFQGHAVWIPGDNPDVILEIEESPEPYRTANLVLRVEIQRESEDGVWTPVWRRELLARDSHWVDGRSRAESGESFSVWIHDLAGDRWFVESHLDLPSLDGLRASKQVTLATDATNTANAQTELGPGLRMVHRLMPIHPSTSEDNA